MRRGPFSRQWRWLTGLGVVTALGLAAALFGEGGALWIVSWLALGAPLLVVARHVWGRP